MEGDDDSESGPAGPIDTHRVAELARQPRSRHPVQDEKSPLVEPPGDEGPLRRMPCHGRTASGSTTSPATSGSGPATTSPSPTESHGCCAPKNPRVTSAADSLVPGQPGAHIPRHVIKGGSHLCAPNYCLRYRPAARQGEAVNLHRAPRFPVRPARIKVKPQNPDIERTRLTLVRPRSRTPLADLAAAPPGATWHLLACM